MGYSQIQIKVIIIIAVGDAVDDDVDDVSIGAI